MSDSIACRHCVNYFTKEDGIDFRYVDFYRACSNCFERLLSEQKLEQPMMAYEKKVRQCYKDGLAALWGLRNDDDWKEYHKLRQERFMSHFELEHMNSV